MQKVVGSSPIIRFAHTRGLAPLRGFQPFSGAALLRFGSAYHPLMAESCRRHSVIDAPIEDVWAIVSDPKTHPDWWPEVEAVRVDGEVGEGDPYTRVTRRLGFLDMVDGVWVVERMEHLKEVHYRCTATGTYTRFALTPAQEDTFVEIEAGIDPANRRWRLAKTVMPTRFFHRWLGDLLDALPRVVAGKDRAPAS
jgi:hypothetical protein